jgi:predicted O-methyltransferase YrrM
MKQFINAFIKRLPAIKKLNEQVRKQGAFPAGHYYSPIPEEEDVLAYVKSRRPPSNELLGVKLNERSQNELLNEYIDFYKDLPFPEKATPDQRYYYDNGWFSYSDAIFLYCFLRKYTPKRIIEIGSGFSSAVMLDTIDSVFSQRPEISFIEPYPNRLISLFKDGDREQVSLIDKKIQEVPSDILLALESGDLLFIDSSHVVKCDSDLHHLMFEILPRLQPGVFVHFHDVFYPFDYPSHWLMEGRYWNENYFLRAFLSYNSEWEIMFFNTYVHHMFGDLIKEKMPLCARNHGGSLYIQRQREA